MMQKDYEDAIQLFEKDLTALINRYSLENQSNTPDFILAKYLVMALVSFNHGIGVRDAWYGRQRVDTSTGAEPDSGWRT